MRIVYDPAKRDAALAEVAPNVVLPGRTKPVAALLAELLSDEQITRLA